MTFYRPFIHPVCELSIAAGRIIMDFYRSGDYDAVQKSDESPVTDADIAANGLIVQALAQWTPDIPIVSEEGEQPQLGRKDRFWIVDPLDGTRSFIRRSDQFTVNIALIDKGVPVFGALYIPVTEVLYYGSRDFGAYRQMPKDAPRRISARVAPEDGLEVVVSMAHSTPRVDAFLEDKPVKARYASSSSLKFGMVADGTVDVYPRFGRTMEWDTAAGQAIVEAAGGRVINAKTGKPLRYGKKGYENPGFIAYGREALPEEEE